MALFSLCSVYEGCRLVFLFYLLLYFLCGVALCVAFVGHWGGTLVAFTVLVGFYWALGWGPCGVHSICSVYEACRSVYFIYLFLCSVAWCGVACRVYGALGWGPCGVHSVCSIDKAFRLVLLVAFRVLVVFMGDYGGTRLAFTALVVFMGHWR